MKTRWITLSLMLALSVPLIALSKLESAGSGKIDSVVNQVTLNGVAAKPGQEIKEGVTLVTGPSSSADIVFSGRNVIRVMENSELVWSLKKLSMKRGGAASVLKNLTKPSEGNDAFTVETEVAVAAVRGTTFFVQVEDDGSTYVCDCNGAVEVGSPLTNERALAVSHHHVCYRISAVNGQAVRKRLTAKDAPAPLYHDDALMQSVASRVNYRIDWQKADVSDPELQKMDSTGW